MSRSVMPSEMFSIVRLDCAFYRALVRYATRLAITRLRHILFGEVRVYEEGVCPTWAADPTSYPR